MAKTKKINNRPARGDKVSTKRVTTATKNAKEVEKKKAAAREYIRELESQGFAVPQHAKQVAFSPTSSKISKKELEKYKGRDSALSPYYLSRHSYMTVTSVYGGGQEHSIDPTKTKLTHWDVTHGTAQKAINEGLRYKVQYTRINPDTNEPETVKRHIQSDRESMFLSMLVKRMTGKDIKSLYSKNFKGYEDEYIKISKDWNGWQTTLAQYTTLKKTPTDTTGVLELQRLASMAYSNPELYEAYREQGDSSRYTGWVQDVVADNKGPTITDLFLEQLSHVLNTSHAWNIASESSSADNSDQVAENYKTLLKIGSQVKFTQDNNIINEFIRKVENEEALVNIEQWFDNSVQTLINDRMTKG